MSGPATLQPPPAGKVPAWFDPEALASAGRGLVRVAGAAVAYRTLGDAAGPAFVLVHGGGANARWWDGVAGALLGGAVPTADPPKIVAMDLSGHGESEWRREYSAELWLEEISAVIEAAAPAGCVLAGHSLGGGLALRMAQLGHPLVTGVVAVDAAPGGPRVHSCLPPGDGEGRRRSLYKSREAAVASFAARKPVWPPWLARHVAALSLRPEGAGWGWAHDPAARPVRPRWGSPGGPWEIPATVLLGGASALTPRLEDAVSCEGWFRGRPLHLVEWPGVGHDIMMEDPVRCARFLIGTAGATSEEARDL